MKSQWTAEELVQHFSLQADERDFIGINAPHNQLGKAVLLKYFQYEACFPQEETDIPKDVIQFIARQLYLSGQEFESYGWNGRRMREHRQQIREWLSASKCE